ncbi:MAG: RsbRD N-terminal domain-containing protein [Desulfovibrio sp.]|nr:RsbRD N-terminal domain-containing protein [Desulfovibrio sp.]MCA1986694.1 RsbRD N-terminal domain-containing protein [Desulfovibrio sp.]
MSFLALLRSDREGIAIAWRDAIYSTYPFDTAGFLRKGQDEFKNPVGVRTDAAVQALVKHLLEETVLDDVALDAALDELVRIRAVQDFTPGKAIGALFLIKGIVRQRLPKLGKLKDHAEAVLRFESKVDSVALRAFDIYVKCRTQLYEMRLKEIKNRHAMLFRHAGLTADAAAEETPDSDQQ